MSRPRSQGFTLVELLVVLSIISLLIAILLPSLSQARDSARTSICLANLKSQSMGLNYYTGDFKDYVPPISVSSGNPKLGTWSTLYANYQTFWSGFLSDFIFLGQYTNNTDVHSGVTEYASNGQIPRRAGAWWCASFTGSTSNAQPLSSYNGTMQGYMRIGSADTLWAGLFKLSNIVHPSKMVFTADSDRSGYWAGSAGNYNFYGITDVVAETPPQNFSSGTPGYVNNVRIRHASLTAANYSFPDGHAITLMDPKSAYANRAIVVLFTE